MTACDDCYGRGIRQKPNKWWIICDTCKGTGLSSTKTKEKDVSKKQ